MVDFHSIGEVKIQAHVAGFEDLSAVDKDDLQTVNALMRRLHLPTMTLEQATACVTDRGSRPTTLLLPGTDGFFLERCCDCRDGTYRGFWKVELCATCCGATIVMNKTESGSLLTMPLRDLVRL